MSDEAPTNPFDVLGGEEAIVALVDRFYERMDTLPEAAPIRAMHAGDLEPIKDKLATFLIGWMGGPKRYSEKFGRVIIPAAHQSFDIGPAERDQWLMCMRRALEDQNVSAEWIERIMRPMAMMADMCMTRSS
ncbi:MAG: group II truncated hemoglobin [Polyangiaceae bacterium]|nr:group II truncated hemoglobin [Polyangiaceae bacterium]